jgi:hypothetical protein
MHGDDNKGVMMSEADRRVIWDEAFRRAPERGGDPKEHFRAMIQEALDRLVADGSVETAGLNGAGKMVYRARSSDHHRKQASE